MKLIGPVPSIRFEIHPHRPDTVEVRAIVGGRFPPESALLARKDADYMAKLIEPEVRAYWEADQREYINRLLYGDPTSKTIPRGILNARDYEEASE